MTTKTHRHHGCGPLALALCFPLLLLTGCSTAEKKAARPAAPAVLIQSPGQKSVTVSAEHSGASIVLERAQTLVVRLPDRATVGVEWSLVDLAPGILATPGPKFERALRNTNVEEAAGASVWQLAPQAAGSVTLNFELRRPRSLLPAVQTVTYAVTVR